MTKRECRKQFRAICRKYDNKTQMISGKSLPEFIRLCNNYIQLAGRAIVLSPTFRLTDRGGENYHQARRALRDVTDIIASTPSDTCPVSLEQLSQAYLDLLKAELQAGVVRIPCVCSPYRPDANVRSNYGAWKVNYSPELIAITPIDSLEALAEHFADYLLSNKRCDLLTFEFKHSVTEEEFPWIQEVAIQMAELFNQYFIEEFEDKQYDQEYQHRDDWDPMGI